MTNNGTIVRTERCQAITKRRGLNRQCKHTTSKSTFCWQHLKAQKGLRIKKSNIPSAGLGLFTTKFIPVGAIICKYTGDLVIEQDPDYGNPYALQVKKRPPTYIDASRSNTAEGRYANDGKSVRKNNSYLLYNRKKQEGYLQSARDIQPNEEILCSYGDDYWKGETKQVAVIPKLRRPQQQSPPKPQRKRKRINIPDDEIDEEVIEEEPVNIPLVRRKADLPKGFGPNQIKRPVPVPIPVPEVIHAPAVRRKKPKEAIPRDEFGNDLRPSVYQQDYLRYTSDPNYFKELAMRAKKLGYKDKQF
jgi:hypothetical protein